MAPRNKGCEYIWINVIHRNAIILEGLNVTTSDKVFDVKQSIADKLRTHYPSEIVLHYNGQLLANRLTLDHYGISGKGHSLVVSFSNYDLQHSYIQAQQIPLAPENQNWVKPIFSSDGPLSAGVSAQDNSLFVDWDDTESTAKYALPCGPSSIEPTEYHSPYNEPIDDSSLISPTSPSAGTGAKVEALSETLIMEIPKHADEEPFESENEGVPANLMSGIELALRINAAASLQSAVLAYSVALQASVVHDGEFGQVAAAEEALREAWFDMEANFPRLGSGLCFS